jgi:hypothetical protein
MPEGSDMLFIVHAGGRLEPVTRDVRPTPQPGETVVLLGPAA